MTILEYKKALDNLTPEGFKQFNENFGGGSCSRDQRVSQFVQNPEHERRICQLLGLITQEERLAQASLKSTSASVISAVAAVVSILLALFSQWQAYDIIRRQLAIADTPRLLIEPAESVQGKVGEFELRLNNPSLADVHDIRIYEDYFVSITPTNGPTIFYRSGLFSVAPNTNLLHLKRGEIKPFVISFKSIVDDMKKLYLGSYGVQAARSNIARLTIRFRRDLDGKEFTQKKVYVIAGHYDCLLDYDERGVSSPGTPDLNDLKSLLGVNSD